MKLADVVEKMKAVVATAVPGQEVQRSRQVLELAGGFLVGALARSEERGQVAILMLDTELGQLVFAYPHHLARGNFVPVDRNSIAGRVMLDTEVVIQNNVPNEPHRDFFERIPGPEGKPRPIQKMVAAPLLAPDGKAIGVVEVSRTGANLAEAGQDFTPQDGDNLAKTCKVLAPWFARTWVREKGY
ncbi:MAG: GAF domain-containing protein [Thermoanaerobaculia bacterium]|nr:GAF domain-containing protein [Thermoanaerobaculia bacterium]